VVIGIEDGWTKRWSKASPPPASPWSVSASKATATTRPSRASRLREFVQDASELQRVECPISELWVSTKCGESDTTSGCGANPTVGNAFDKLYPLATRCVRRDVRMTGGEHLVAARCRTTAPEFMTMFDRYQAMIERHKTSDLSDSQPTKGNIAGGLTTIEEKALGNIQKIGRTCKIDGVLDKAEAPTGPGLWFMDSSSPPPRW
jgi:(2R)-sulfolactate sulfo-lyase subunit beta